MPAIELCHEERPPSAQLATTASAPRSGSGFLAVGDAILPAEMRKPPCFIPPLQVTKQHRLPQRTPPCFCLPSTLQATGAWVRRRRALTLRLVQRNSLTPPPPCARRFSPGRLPVNHCARSLARARLG